MRLRFEATPQELQEKGEELIKALVEEFHDVDHDLAERLEKSLPSKEPVLKYPVLRAIHKKTTQAYEAMLDSMLVEIGKVLDESVVEPKRLKKSMDLKKAMDEAASELEEPVYDHTQPLVEKDEKAYNRVKAILKKRGYQDSDFERGGKLFGMSTNELIDLARDNDATDR